MKGSEIREFLAEQFEELVPCFLGIFWFDNCPAKLRENSFCIVNRSKRNELGSHWFALVQLNGTLEVFDSLGSDFKTLQFLRPFKNSVNFAFNTSKVQSFSSDTCGGFCLLFICQRLLNFDLTFSDCLNLCFKLNLEENEQKVRNFLMNGKL